MVKHKTNNFIIKFVDHTNLSIFILFFIVGLMLSSIAYFYLSKIGQGIAPTFDGCIIDYSTCLYFSVVTISSLGYGDFRPIGIGRSIAIAEVIYGLVILSLIVAKLASERQNVLIKLIYSSDNERRLKGFRDELSKLSDEFSAYVSDPFAEDDIKNYIKNSKLLIFSINSYLMFHMKQGVILEVGADRNIQGIYKNLLKLQFHCQELAKVSLFDIRKDLEYICMTIIENTKNYLLDDKSNESRQIYMKMIDEYEKYNSSLKENLHNQNLRAYCGFSVMTDSLVILVEKNLPERPWKKNIHKDVAKKLSISNKLAHKTISEIVKSAVGVRS